MHYLAERPESFEVFGDFSQTINDDDNFTGSIKSFKPTVSEVKYYFFSLKL